MQLNRRLNSLGRNITFRGTFSYGDNDSESFSEALTRYFDAVAGKPDDDNRRYTTSPTKNYDYTAELTYNEPIAKATFLQFRYKFQYKYSEKHLPDEQGRIRGNRGPERYYGAMR